MNAGWDPFSFISFKGPLTKGSLRSLAESITALRFCSELRSKPFAYSFPSAGEMNVAGT